MQAFTLFKQKFAVAESLLQLHRLFSDLREKRLPEEMRLAICSAWAEGENTTLQHAQNDRVMICAKAASPVPANMLLDGGFDFLLRQAIVVASTCLESFFWDALRENVLTVVKARKNRAHESLRDLTLTVGDYISMQRYEDPEERLKQIILKNFERGTIYSTDSVEEVANILTVRNYWQEVAGLCGERDKDLKRRINELVSRRNQIAHRADRPADDEETDSHGLRPIKYPWVNTRVQAANSFVSASHEVFTNAITQLEADIAAAEEQAAARALAKAQEANNE